MTDDRYRERYDPRSHPNYGLDNDGEPMPTPAGPVRKSDADDIDYLRAFIGELREAGKCLNAENEEFLAEITSFTETARKAGWSEDVNCSPWAWLESKIAELEKENSLLKERSDQHERACQLGWDEANHLRSKLDKLIGPFKIIRLNATTEGGHGGYRNFTLKRYGFEPMEIYMEFDEYKELELGDEINIALLPADDKEE